MVQSLRKKLLLPALLAPLLLAACGGGGSANDSAFRPVNTVAALDPNGPPATGDAATDGFNWFNFRRQQMGLAPVARNSRIDVAAKGHSDYQTVNGITHDQVAGNPGFTGVTLSDRLKAASYPLPTRNYAIGEVISMTSDPSGYNAAEGLIAAIYHRFVAFEPMFKEAGSGAARSGRGFTFLTVDFASIGLGPDPVTGVKPGLPDGEVVTYPFANQQLVPVNFFSDNEVPDPVPGKNEVGYPVSIHANGTATVDVDPQNFTIRRRGGAPLETQLLTYRLDPAHTPGSAAAIIPVNSLTAATTYDVQFTGTIDGRPVARNWSFTTR